MGKKQIPQNQSSLNRGTFSALIYSETQKLCGLSEEQRPEFGYLETLSNQVKLMELDVSDIGSLLTPALQALIKKEAVALGLLKPNATTKLPFI